MWGHKHNPIQPQEDEDLTQSTQCISTTQSVSNYSKYFLHQNRADLKIIQDGKLPSFGQAGQEAGQRRLCALATRPAGFGFHGGHTRWGRPGSGSFLVGSWKGRTSEPT